MLLNIATCLLIAVASFYASRVIYKKRKTDKIMAFALFWFIVSLQWIFSAIRTYFAFNEAYDYDVFFYKWVEIAVGIYMIPFFYFVISKTFKNTRLIYSLTTLFSVGVMAYIYFLITQKITFVSQSYFATEYTIGNRALILFQLLFATLLVFLLFEISKEIVKNIRQHTFNKKNMLSFLSVLIYSIAGYFDQVGEPSGWKIITIRVILSGTALLASMAYLNSNEERYEKEDKEFIV